MVGGIYLVRVVATTVKTPDVLIRHRGYHFFQFRVFTKEMLTRISAAFLFEVLVFAVYALFHAFLQEAVLIHCEQWIPIGARSEEHTSELQSRENLVCRLLLEK